MSLKTLCLQHGLFGLIYNPDSDPLCACSSHLNSIGSRRKQPARAVPLDTEFYGRMFQSRDANEGGLPAQRWSCFS